MGWSCTAIADEVLRALEALLHGRGRDAHGCSNGFHYKGHDYFYETSRREHSDGSITGSVSKTIDGYAHDAGSFKINGSGRIERFPTTTVDMRAEAIRRGKKRYDELFNPLFRH